MLENINALIQSTVGQYLVKLINMGITAVAGALAITPDATVAPTISNFLLACIMGGVALAINHFTHPATPAPAAPATPAK